MSDKNFSLVTRHMLEQGLTYHQARVVYYLLDGQSNKEIGESLFITEKGVKDHLTLCYKALGLRNRVQLVLWCFKTIGAH